MLKSILWGIIGRGYPLVKPHLRPLDCFLLHCIYNKFCILKIVLKLWLNNAIFLLAFKKF